MKCERCLKRFVLVRGAHGSKTASEQVGPRFSRFAGRVVLCCGPCAW